MKYGSYKKPKFNGNLINGNIKMYILEQQYYDLIKMKPKIFIHKNRSWCVFFLITFIGGKKKLYLSN